ncbi:hypothetical protein PC112_g21350 [Phytophthora cactorum]|nr:hypothetical protein PC112_g21350 [Phytophthora cactorum]
MRLSAPSLKANKCLMPGASCCPGATTFATAWSTRVGSSRIPQAYREIKSKRFQLREALKLLAVVALVDHTTWRKLLIHSGVLNIKYVVPEEFDGEFPAPFLLGLPYGKRAPTDDYESLVRGRFVHDTKPEDVLRGDLVFFCGVEQHTRRSKEYDAALTKIIGIWRESQQELGDVPDEIEVPIAIQVSPAVARYGGGMITYVQNVLKAVRHLREQTWPRAVKRKEMPRVTFVLESIGADLRPVPIRSDLTSLVENLSRDGIFCSGLAFRQDIGVRGKQGAARKVVGKLLTSLFGGTPGAQSVSGAKVLTGSRVKTSGSPGQLALSSLNFHCEPHRSWFLERFCSSAVVNQTTSHISITMQVQDENPKPSVYTWRWQWVCYGFFSKRARQLSRLERLTLQNVLLHREDVEAMRVVMLSAFPEEELLGFGQQEQQEEHRDFSIKAKASLRLQPMAADEELGSNASFTVSREIRGVQILGNNTDNGWVDVLVPGFGKCQTRRSSLVQIGETTAEATGLSSLMVVFAEDPDDDLLCEFLGVIGGSLQDLTVQVSNFRTAMIERITATCPRLREVAIWTTEVEARFQVRDSRLNPIVVHPTVPYSFENATDLIRSFCMTEYPFARAVRRLRVRIMRTYGDETATPLEECYATLLGLLARNRTLEYLDVLTSTADPVFALLFKKFHLEKLPVVKGELSVKNKLAFLSITAQHDLQTPKRTKRSRCLPVLDRNSISLVFAFAATPLDRKVYFGSTGYTCTEMRSYLFPI